MDVLSHSDQSSASTLGPRLLTRQPLGSTVVSRIVVVGGGVAGLAAALKFGRAGHQVEVLERDPTPMPPTADEAFDWDRRGAPQVRHSHAFLARLYGLLRDHEPDVLAAYKAAGADETFVKPVAPAMLLQWLRSQHGSVRRS